MDVALFDDIAAEELKVNEHYLAKYGSARQDSRLVHQQRLQPARVRSFLRNPEDRVASTVARTSYANEILIGITGDAWIDPVIRGARSNDAFVAVAALGGTTNRRVRLMDPALFRSVDNPEVWEVRHSLIATASAQRIRQLAEQGFYVKTRLRDAVQLIATRDTRDEPAGYVSDPDTDAWVRVLSRATKIRTGEKVVVTAPPEAHRLFNAWHDELTTRFERMPHEDAYNLAALFDLPPRLYGVLQFAAEHSTGGQLECAGLAVSLASWVRDRMFELHNAGGTARQDDAREAHRDRLLRKIIERGPLTRRELLRSETVQRWDEHCDEINVLLRGKQIVLDRYGRYCAVPIAPANPSPSTTVHHVS